MVRGKLLVGLVITLALLAFASSYENAVGGDVTPFDSGRYVRNSFGFDISFPQCVRGFPSESFGYGIVGVTHGKAFTYNGCLRDEFAWAQNGTSAPPSLYMNLNFPVSKAPARGSAGPKGNCESADLECIAYNYGYNAAQDAFSYAARQSVSAQTWWLDVETMNTWSPDTDVNDVVIQAALDFFGERGIVVGVYSTRLQWNIIAGSAFVPVLPHGARLPNWIATGANSSSAPRFCSPRNAFGGGVVWLVQYVNGDFDNNYACDLHSQL
ncbi:MAG: hypothetical protein LC737_09705 [Chloroflexi bacterium]|nr:hypothetical protein [Chloroflexota bacterium]